MKKILGLLVVSVFTHVSEASFVVKYITKSGVQWSQTLPGSFTNGCPSSSASYCPVRDGVVYDYDEVVPATSEAYLACQSIGGRLPSAWDYLELIREFDHSYCRTSLLGMFSAEPCLTPQGVGEFVKIFDDSRPEYYWTSTIRRYHFGTMMGLTSGYTLYTDGKYRGSLSEAHRANRQPVRCVQ